MTLPDFASNSVNLVLENTELSGLKVGNIVSNEITELVYLDHGVDRIVFTIESPSYNNMVLKIARNKGCFEENKKEYNNWDNLKYTKYADWLCPIDLNKSTNSCIFMDKVNMNKGNIDSVIQNLSEIAPIGEVVSQNVGYHDEQGHVLTDYTFKI